MSESIANLNIELRATANKLASDISRDIEAQKSQIEASSIALGGVIAAGITAGIAGIGAAIKSAVSLGFEGLDRIDALDEMSTKIGVAYNAMQDFKYAAETTGSSVEAMVSAIGKMEGNLASGSMDDALSSLSLNAEQLKKLAPEQQFLEIADRLSQMKSTADKIDLTKQIFGKGGVDIMNVINLGKSGMGDISKLVEKLGGHLTDAQRIMVGMANDNIDELKKGWGYVKDQVAVGLAPALVVVTKYLVEQAEKTGGIGKLVQEWVDAALNFSGALLTVAQLVNAVGSGFHTVGVIIGSGLTLLHDGYDAYFKTMRVEIQDLEISFKRLAVNAADAIISSFNAAKNESLKIINDLQSEATILAASIAKKLPGADTAGQDALIAVTKHYQDNYDPKKLHPDLPTGDQPGAPQSLLFPDGVPVVDYTEANAAVDKYSLKAIAAQDEITAAAKVTGEKMKAIWDGKYWGDSFRESVAAEQKALAERVSNAGNAAKNLLDMNRAASEEDLKAYQQEYKEMGSLLSSMGKEIYEENKKIQEANRQTMEQFQSGNRAVVTDMVAAWATGTGKISDIVSQWANQMIKQFIQLSLFGNGGSIGGLIGGTSGTLGSVLGGLFGGGASAGATGAAADSIFGGAFASGGRPPMGKISLIGEHGAELWMPDSAGRIIPNDKVASFLGSGASGGGQSVQVESPITITQNFGTGVTHADLAGMADQIMDQTRAGVLEAVRRGGGYRKGVQS